MSTNRPGRPDARRSRAHAGRWVRPPSLRDEGAFASLPLRLHLRCRDLGVPGRRHIENDWAEWERAGKLKETTSPLRPRGRPLEPLRARTSRCPERRRGGVPHLARVGAHRARARAASTSGARRYRERLERCGAGLRPVVTLHHFTHPHVVSPARRRGTRRRASTPSARYAKVCAEMLNGLDAAVHHLQRADGASARRLPAGHDAPGHRRRAAKRVAAIGNIARRARRRPRGNSGRLRQGRHCGISPAHAGLRAGPALAPARPGADPPRGAQAYNHAFLEALAPGDLRMRMPGVLQPRGRSTRGRARLDAISSGVNYYTRAHLRFVPRPAVRRVRLPRRAQPRADRHRLGGLPRRLRRRCCKR